MVDAEYDVASDLSVFHRIDDMYAMGSRRWAQLVPRLPYYQGACRAAAMAQQAPETASVAPPVAAASEGGGVAPQAQYEAPAGPWKPDKVVESTRAALAFSDIGDMFSFGTA